MIVHAIVDSPEAAWRAAATGATVVQLRLKGATTAERVAAGRALHGVPAVLVMNDDVEAALSASFPGVHLGQDDAGVARARAAGLLLGRSAATLEEAIAAEREGAAYVGVGPVWETPTKPDAGPALGLEGLRAIASGVRIPAIAIGGIDAGNAARCVEAGADGVAVVRAAEDCARLRAEVVAALRRRTAGMEVVR